MSDLPTAADIAQRTSTAEVEPNCTANMCCEAICAQREELYRFEDVEDLASAVDRGDASGKELERLLVLVRNALSRELTAARVPVAIEVLDELLFAHFKNPQLANPLPTAVETLWRFVSDSHALLVFPLHSLGIRGPDPLGDAQVLARADWGLAVSAQTNDLDETLVILEECCQRLGLSGGFPGEPLRQRRNSRGSAWLERNPLLLIRIREPVGSAYPNQEVLLSRLQVTTAFLAMLSTISGQMNARGLASLYSSTINNEETLDIHHYVVLAPESSEAPAAFVPITGWRPEMVEMSDLEVRLDQDGWRGDNELADRLHRECEAFFTGYLRHGLEPPADDDGAHAYRKVYEALAYFKRSFTRRPWQRAISLAIAFELLLADEGHKNTSKRVGNTIAALPDLSEGERRAYKEAFINLYAARGEIVHAGQERTRYDVNTARRAFVAAFLAEAARLTDT
jgi:hypothetical protein